MIRIMAISHNKEIIPERTLQELSSDDVWWYWVDFNVPTKDEAALLDTHFHFHPLAVDDCFHLLQRPKLDHYDDMHFFVLHAMHQQTLAAQEVDLFWGANYIVTFHMAPSSEVDEAWRRFTEQKSLLAKGHVYAAYMVMNKLVDNYFPAVYQIEEQLDDIDANGRDEPMDTLMNEIFAIRARLLKLRKTIVPMRDLLYRIINTDKLVGIKSQVHYFTDIHDHLLKLSEIIESNRETTADIRDSYMSINSYRMNTIMKTLTVITTIFMPLTFIAGIYGMNFEHMPELKWQWGYFIILIVMLGIGFSMYAWFRRKGWFD